MIKQRKVLYFVTAVLLIITVLVCIVQAGQVKERPFSVEISSGGKTERIDIWQREAGEYYVFLPGYTDLSQVRICLNTENAVSINGVPLEEGMYCDAFALDVPYEFVYTVWGKDYEHRITFLRSANVATMYIDTQSGSMEYIHEKKGNEESGTLRLYTADGSIDYEGDLESINGRGNASWRNSEKKSYSLKLINEADLLGMGQAQKWILLSNADDYSNMRNKIVYDFAADIGLQYSPDSHWADVFLNGEYAGLYLLCERNEVHPNRVDIANDASFLVSLEIGSRLISQNYPYISTESGKNLRIHYYHDSNAKLTDIWQTVENAIQAHDDVDPVTKKKLDEVIDIDSWVIKYLIEEIFGNIDAGNISQFFYYNGNRSDAKIVAGPVWDYDHALGNMCEWQLAAPNAFFSNREIIENGSTTPWYFTLNQKHFFANKLVAQYRETCLPLLEELLTYRIPDYLKQINTASKLNQVRWHYGAADVAAETEYMCSFLEARIGFLSKIWVDQAEYHLVKALPGSNGYYGYYVVFPGEKMVELPTFESTNTSAFQGWYYEDTDEPFDSTKPITEDIEIYAKWAEKPSKRFGQIGKLIPLGVIAMIGVVLLIVDIKRMKRNR